MGIKLCCVVPKMKYQSWNQDTGFNLRLMNYNVSLYVWLCYCLFSFSLSPSKNKNRKDITKGDIRQKKFYTWTRIRVYTIHRDYTIG